MNTNKKNLIGLIITAVLLIIAAVVDIIITIFVADHDNAGKNIFCMIITLISFIAIIYYIILGYKKPHGNLLRYLFIVYALTVSFNALVVLFSGQRTFYGVYGILELVISLNVMYMAGRLNKLKENQIISIITLIEMVLGLIFCLISTSASAFDKMYCGLFTIQFLTVLLAYYSRYKAHKEAGLEEVK